MLSEWTERRILVLGTTYPSYSTKYVENVCTGGLLEDSFEMVRIHPVPKRYLEEGQRFKNFQWIKAMVMKDPKDPRPESLRIKPDSIEVLEEIPSAQHDERRRLVERTPHLFKSVEELKERNDSGRSVSLGTIRPKEITGVRLVKKSEKERKEWTTKEKELLAQQDIFERPPKPIDFPEMEFLVSWRCDDPRCVKGHEMRLLQWGIHELYRKYRSDPDGENKVKDAMLKQLDMSKRDVFLFLGNFRGVMYNFGLMDSYCPPKQVASAQGSLFSA